MQCAKISLSGQQIELVTNADWILTKNDILKKIKAGFEALQQQQAVLINQNLPAEILETGSKISRGENYGGLPWIVLDHPRHFVKGNIFAIRTMFWWGRFFTTTLHLSGNWQQKLAPQLMAGFTQFQQKEMVINSEGNEWVHDITHAAYRPFKNTTQKEFEKILSGAPFVKIAAYTGINNIETAPELLLQQFQTLLSTVVSKN